MSICICSGLAFIAIMMFVMTARAKFEQITMSRKQGGDNANQAVSFTIGS
jgi:hypothetical protein